MNIFGRLLDNTEMEAITLCQDYLEGDLVKQCFLQQSFSYNAFLQISWTAGTYTVQGNVTRAPDVLSYSQLCKPTKPWQRLFPVQLPALEAISVS